MRATRALQILLAIGAMTRPGAAQVPSAPLSLQGAPWDSLVARFYEQRTGRLAWSDSGVVSQDAAVLLRALTGAADDGLDPQAYPTTAITALLRDAIPPDRAARLDSLLTLGFFEYGSAVSRGRISPLTVDSLWKPTPHATDLVRLLERGIDSGRVASVLRALPPAQPGYRRLRRGLAHYRDVAARGGWPTLPAGPSLLLGSRSPRVALLRQRLAAEGYGAPADGDTERVDDGLQATIRQFQDRHGLAADGIVGVATRDALNVSPAARLQQITVNLERWRWLPRDMGERYLVVNSPAFTLALVDGGHAVLTTRAIVGRPDWPTPITSSRVTDVAFRPLWHIPRAIASRELLPLLQGDPDYLTREGMRVFGDSATGGREIDPATIDWTAVTESTFAYRLVQEPGPDNPLGGVKLVLWTPFDVFIHDTPVRPLFSERLRAFSHGCIRVEKAAELVTHLLPDWSVDSIQAAMTLGRERRVRLPASIPVHLVYFTAWSDEDGTVEFRDDVYGWDQRLAAALATWPAPRVALLPAPRQPGCGR